MVNNNSFEITACVKYYRFRDVSKQHSEVNLGNIQYRIIDHTKYSTKIGHVNYTVLTVSSIDCSITSLTGEFGPEDFELIPHSPVRYLFIFAFVLIHDGSNIQLHN